MIAKEGRADQDDENDAKYIIISEGKEPLPFKDGEILISTGSIDVYKYKEIRLFALYTVPNISKVGRVGLSTAKVEFRAFHNHPLGSDMYDKLEKNGEFPSYITGYSQFKIIGKMARFHVRIYSVDPQIKELKAVVTAYLIK